MIKRWMVTLFCLVIVISVGMGCGRTPSRYLGQDARQVLSLPNLTSVNDVVSISFDKRGSSTVKDVTYRATDGYLYTCEFKDVSPFGGVIRWVGADESESVIQSRAISRWTGGVVNLALPKECAKVLNVDIGYSGKTERSKNVTCLTADGRVLAKEYREGLLDRHFGGWLEVKGES